MSQIPDVLRSAFERMASADAAVSKAGAEVVCAAVDANLYKVQVLEGDVVAAGVFYPDPIPYNARITYPIDPFAKENLKDWMAWELSTSGGMPTRMAMGDEFTVTPFTVTNSQTWLLDYLKSARYNHVQRALEVFTNGVLMKNNRDAMHTLLGAAKARAVASSYVNDPAAAPGKLTPTLYFNLEAQMPIRGGGNYGSIGRRKLTDLFVPTDGLNQVRVWDLNTLPEAIRQAAWTSGVNGLGIGDIKFHPVDEFSAGQEYDAYWNALNGADNAGGSDTNFVLGLDLSDKQAAFVHPVVEPFKSYPEGEIAFKRNEGGIWGRGRWGWAVIDDRYTIAGSY